MPPDTPHDVVVVGAGPTGLAAALRLARAGVRVAVVEAASEPGGLCRTLEWEGLRFDIGGHRFHTAYGDVQELVEGVAGDELIEVERRSRIHLGSGFLHFPPTVLDTLRRVPGVGVAAGVHGVLNSLLGPHGEPAANLEQYLVRQFGRPLYDLVFHDYTHKVWGLLPEAISPDWGAARVGGLSLRGLLRQALGIGRGGARSTERFLYPAQGYGRIFLRMAQAIEAAGGEVICGFPVTRIHTPEGGPVILESGERRVAGDRVLSTMPLASMVELLDPEPEEATLAACRSLRYRALVLVILKLDGDAPISDDTWLYFPQAQTPFCRLHEPTNWSRELAPPGSSHVVVEYFCDEGDPLWDRGDAELADEVSDGLRAAGLLDPERVAAHKVLRFGRAYPIYDQSYRATLDGVEAELDRRPGLLRAGRAGAFLYLSSDECMRHGLVAADRLLTTPPPLDEHAVIGRELVLLSAHGLELEPGATDRMAQTLKRRAAEVCFGTLAAVDGRSALARADQLLAEESQPFPGLALVRRAAWEAAGGLGIDPASRAAMAVLERVVATPHAVAVREPSARARASDTWWAALPRSRERWRHLGVPGPGLRRKVASVGLYATPALLLGGSSPLLALIGAAGLVGFALASLPGWTSLLRSPVGLARGAWALIARTLKAW